MIYILFFAKLREQLNQSSTVVKVDSPITVETLKSRLNCEDPRYHCLLEDDTICAINENVSGPSAVVEPGDTVAFFPPVTGG